MPNPSPLNLEIYVRSSKGEYNQYPGLVTLGDNKLQFTIPCRDHGNYGGGFTWQSEKQCFAGSMNYHQTKTAIKNCSPEVVEGVEVWVTGRDNARIDIEIHESGQVFPGYIKFASLTEER